MSLRLAVRLIIDLAMTILLLCALAYRITGDAAHEWIGIGMTALFVVHNAVNWKWYRGLFRGKYDFRRILNTAVNLLLLATMTALVISGTLLSWTALSFMGFSGGMEIRQAHTAAAYWSLILVAVHVGTHWEMIMASMLKMMKITGVRRVRTIASRVVTALIVVYGVYASFDRDMGAKLFLGYSFDFWNPERPAALFFSHNLAVIGVYVCATHYALKWITFRSRSG
jgi:hypothetical protein